MPSLVGSEMCIRDSPYIARHMWKEEEADAVIDLDNEFYEKMQEENMQGCSLESIEYIYTGTIFNRLLINHHGCMLHSSAVVVDGYAYLFSADSGTGKSTHTGLWIEHFKEKAFICLLYTSDAADDLLCVDLGGRRIIKKKKNIKET